ncbi:MAG: hypothetical protein VKS61_10580 [Candidatus Sericytochromatia bacterium]|nr:hypothetical protein [Candidatus Sericytochromatia bacterium]
MKRQPTHVLPTALILAVAAATAACTPPGATTAARPGSSPRAARPAGTSPAPRGPETTTVTPPPNQPAPTSSGTPTPEALGTPTLPLMPLASLAPTPAPVAGEVLSGRVRVPATLLSDNGAGLLGDRSSALTPGGVYRLRQAAPAWLASQAALANATVEVLDARGQAVRSPAGVALVASTDAGGAFRFTDPLPNQNLVLRVALAAAKGTLLAVVPQEADARRDRQIDLVSTLTTSYILNQFVLSQEDAQGSYDRLPPAIEAETRSLAASAAGSLLTTPPEDLSTTRVVQTVEALRKGNPGFDAQMEKVKGLLVVAGQSNRGEGRPATTVSLNYVTGLQAGPDGSTYIYSYDDRVWRVRPDGVFETAYLGGQEGGGSLAGKTVQQLRYKPSREEVAYDALGRPVLWVDDEVLRVKADGTLELLAGGMRHYKKGLVKGPGDALWLVQENHGAREVWEVKPGAEPHQLCNLQLPEGRGLDRVACDATGRLLVQLGGDGRRTYHAVDVRDGSLADLAVAGKAAQADMDAFGNLLYVDEYVLWVLRPGQAAPERLCDWQASLAAVEMAPDGRSALAADYYQVYRVANGQATLIAGIDPKASTGGVAATDFSFQLPAFLAVGADGVRWVWDKERNQLVKMAQGELAQVLPVGLDGCYDGCPVAGLRVGKDGKPLLRLENTVVTIAGENIRRTVYSSPTRVALTDFDALPDGSLLLGLEGPERDEARVVRRAPDGTVTELFTATLPLRDCSLAAGPGGSVYLSGARALRRWTPAGGLETLMEGSQFQVATDDNDGRRFLGLAVSAAGKVYGASPGYYDGGDDVPGGLWMFDPIAPAFRMLAGPRGTMYNGTGPDQSVAGAGSPAFTPAGDLLFIDRGNRQIKRIPKDKL